MGQLEHIKEAVGRVMESIKDTEIFKVMDGMEEVNRKMVDDIEASAPTCHFRKMTLEQSDSIDGYYEQWWECSVCGHIKQYE